MKLRFKSFAMLALISASLGLTSCDNTDVPAPDEEKSEVLSPQEFLNITYDGKTYLNVPTAYDEDGEFVFLDEDFSTIYEDELKNLSTLSINLVDESTIEVYKDLESNLSSHNISMSDLPPRASTRAIIPDDDESIIGKIELFDDKKFKDRSITLALTKFSTSNSCPDLGKQYKFSDKCSSARLTCYLSNDPTKEIQVGDRILKYSEVDLIFIGHDDTWYGDRTFTIIAKPNNRIREFRELKNFNDKMSSAELFFFETGIFKTEGASK